MLLKDTYQALRLGHRQPLHKQVVKFQFADRIAGLVAVNVRRTCTDEVLYLFPDHGTINDSSKGIHGVFAQQCYQLLLKAIGTGRRGDCGATYRSC